jgi:hypothetical protein
MQNTSTAWKEAQEQTIVPESFVELSYRVGDPAAQLDVTATDNGSEPFANTAQIVDELEKTYEKYATFEQDIWILDGTMKLLPDVVTQDMGFVSSELCNESGVFERPPVITLSFTQIHTTLTPGVTIQWTEAFGEHATAFAVTAYNGATVVATKTVTNNDKVLSVVEMDLENYNKIEIEILEWCYPYHRARIEEILVGAVQLFTKSDLLAFEHGQSVDLLSAELPKSHITFSLHNVEGEWNPNNPQGLWRYLLERQEIVVRYGYKIGNSIEWIKSGTFYMSEWDTPSNGIYASFTARDLLEFMQGKFEVTTTTLNLFDLATQALTQSELPVTKEGQNRWYIDSSLSAIAVTLPEDFDFTCAEVVQLCANAACCVFYQDRNGILRIEPLADVLTDYVISKHVSYANAEYEIGKELKAVDVNEGMGTATNSATGEVQLVENPLIQNIGVANDVAEWIKDCLKNRKTLSGEFRADPRLDALDKVTVENKYATNSVFITSVKYSYGGAFRGEYEGRVATP